MFPRTNRSSAPFATALASARIVVSQARCDRANRVPTRAPLHASRAMRRVNGIFFDGAQRRPAIFRRRDQRKIADAIGCDRRKIAGAG
jgi:hypothetical protein